MELKEIQNLIKFVAKSGASEVSLEMGEIKITIKTEKGEAAAPVAMMQQTPTVAMPAAPAAIPPAPLASEPIAAAAVAPAETTPCASLASPPAMEVNTLFGSVPPTCFNTLNTVSALGL